MSAERRPLLAGGCAGVGGDTVKAPDIRRVVGSCMACHHWQIDVRAGAVSDLGGARESLIAMASAHAEHLPDCPAGEGRIRFDGQWVEPPKMADGKPASGTMALNPLPVWWVAK